MRFRVVGCKKDSGEGMDLFLEAPNQAWAERMAKQRGILIDSIDPAPVKSPPAPAVRPHAPGARPPAPVAKAQPPRPATPAEQPVELTDDLAVLEEVPAAEAAIPAPPTSPRSQPRAPRKPIRIPKPLIMGLALLCVVGLGWMAWTLGLSRWFFGGIKTYEAYIPPDASMIAYVDLAALRKSDLYKENAGNLPGPMSQNLPISLSPEDVDELFMAGSAKGTGPGVVVFKTKADKSLGDLGLKDAKMGKVDAVEYAQLGRGFCLAKVSARTFCGCDSEQKLRETLDRVKKGSRPQLSAEIELALKGARGEDSLIVMQTPAAGGLDESFGIPRVVGVGFSAGSSISVRAVAIFTDAKTAEKAKKMYDDTLKQAQGAANSPQAKKLLALLERAKVSQSDNAMYIKGSWKYADVKSALEDFGPNLPVPGMPQPRPAQPTFTQPPPGTLQPPPRTSNSRSRTNLRGGR